MPSILRTWEEKNAESLLGEKQPREAGCAKFVLKPRKKIFSQTHATEAGLRSGALDFAFSARHVTRFLSANHSTHAACIHVRGVFCANWAPSAHLLANCIAAPPPHLFLILCEQRPQPGDDRAMRINFVGTHIQRKGVAVFCWYLNLGQYFGVLCTPALSYWAAGSFRVMYVITLAGLETIGAPPQKKSPHGARISWAMRARPVFYCAARTLHHKRKVIV